MKCGYCGNDFAESQHHYCPEGQRFLLAELASLRATVDRMTSENRRDALEGQATLDEANNEVLRLRASNAAKDVEIERLKAILADALEWGMTSKHFDAGRSLKNGEDARAALSRAEPPKPEPATCVWDHDPSCIVLASCGHRPCQSPALFCSGCGKRVEVRGRHTFNTA